MSDPQSSDQQIQMVDDLFWLRRAGDLVTGGATLRADAARQLMSALAWLWTVYTGAALLGGVAARTHLPPSRSWLLALPSFLIVIAYAAAVLAYMPLTVSFDPRDPDDVREAYSTAVSRGLRRLQLALALAGLAAVSIGLAIVVVTTSR